MPQHLFALGSNSNGQLGVGHKNDISQPELCRFSDGGRVYDQVAEDDVAVAKIVAGGNHTIVLATNGKVSVAGKFDGVQNWSEEEAEEDVFREVVSRHFGSRSGSRITDVAASWAASYFVIDNRIILACGNGRKGELGLGLNVMQTEDVSLVKDLGEMTEIVCISASMSHVVLVTADGKLHGWGSSRQGQLGDEHQSTKVVWEPAEIRTPFHVLSAVTGRDFTFIKGPDEQHLLLGNKRSFVDDTQVLAVNRQSQVYSGWSNVYVLEVGRLTGAGRSNNGQLPPADIPSLQYFAAGSEHCVATLNDQEVIAWGWGEHGNCGPPRNSPSTAFSKIHVPLADSESVIGVAAGCATSFVIVEAQRKPD